MPQPPPDGLPVHRLLTGSDDDAFCRRVSEALQLGYQLYGSPAVASDRDRDRDRDRVTVAQAVLWPARLPPSTDEAGRRRWPLSRNGRSLTADGSAVTTDSDGLADKPKLHKRPVIDPVRDAALGTWLPSADSGGLLESLNGDTTGSLSRVSISWSSVRSRS